ncbi:MAG: peptidylprolyl isomerase [Caldisericia bacterium]
MKKITTVLAVLMMVVLVASCGAKTNTEKVNNETEPVKKIEETKKIEEKKIEEIKKPVEEKKVAEEKTEEVSKPVEEKPQTTETDKGNIVAVFETNYGTYEVTLWVGKAPIAAGNMADKIKAGFFNNLTFHRIVNGFVIQGGDPLGNGTGGGNMNVDPKFTGSSNVKGTIAMASSTTGNPMPYQSDAQFFINLGDNSFLDGSGFIAFGEVTKGMDVVDKIANVETTYGPGGREKSTPVEPVLINKAYIK